MSNDAVAEGALPRAPRRCVLAPMIAASTKKKTDDRLSRLMSSACMEGGVGFASGTAVTTFTR